MRNVDRSWIARCLILFAGLMAGVNVGSAADDSPLANLAAALEARRGEQVEVLAPRSFAAAAEAYEAALKDSERGRSPERIGKLEQVKADLQRFADPRRSQGAEGERLVKELPVVVWLIHGVHGNEISSADAALLEAYHLLASQGDAGVDAVLRDALVLIV